MKVTTLGLDLAKTVFHLVGLDEKGHEVMKKKVFRNNLAATIQLTFLKSKFASGIFERQDFLIRL